MAEKFNEIVIAKDQAAFWLDKHGQWHSADGKFRHKKIIDFFHASIKKDKNGYYIGQTRGNYKEKVYFYYEDTALFVFDVVIDGDITLILNNRQQVRLRPEKLSVRDDNLYMHLGEETIKFAEQGLMKISDLLEYKDDRYVIRVKNRKYKISMQNRA